MGWNAPRKSLELGRPGGLACTSSNKDLHFLFDSSLDYNTIAKTAAGNDLVRSDEFSRRLVA